MQNISYFSVNIRSRNKVDIEIRATDGGSQASSPLTQQPHLQFAMRDHWYQFAAVHTHVYLHHDAAHRRPHGQADVSTCLPITDCSGIVDREGGRSFSFGRSSYFSLPRMFASFASCNTASLILLFHIHRFHSSYYPSFSSSSFSTGTNPTVHRRSSSSLFLVRHSPLLRPKGNSINLPREIVTRNMEYWVRAKLPLSPGRRRREQGTR